MFREVLEIVSASPLDEVGVAALLTKTATDSRWFPRQGERYVVGGMRSVLEVVQGDVPVELGAEVKRVEHDQQGVRVFTGSQTHTADAAIVTVSAGVLAAGAIAFSPELPAEQT